jgi:hypothetical protein
LSASEELIAWAAGLYDGEGSASMYMPRKRRTARRQMQVSQGGEAGVPPEVLLRFRQIVGDGSVTGPYRGYLFYWKTTRKDALDSIALRLWPYLSEEKRSQFEYMTTAAGRELPRFPLLRRSAVTEIAWAAGLFDGEGSLSLSGPADRSRRFVTMELPQSGASGIPDALIRFRDVVEVGAIGGPYPPRSPWSRLPRYRWRVTGRHRVSHALFRLWPWLGSVKRDQIRRLSAYLDAPSSYAERTGL